MCSNIFKDCLFCLNITQSINSEFLKKKKKKREVILIELFTVVKQIMKIHIH